MGDHCENHSRIPPVTPTLPFWFRPWGEPLLPFHPARRLAGQISDQRDEYEERAGQYRSPFRHIQQRKRGGKRTKYDESDAEVDHEFHRQTDRKCSALVRFQGIVSSAVQSSIGEK